MPHRACGTAIIWQHCGAFQDLRLRCRFQSVPVAAAPVGPLGILHGTISSGSAASLVAFSSCQPTCAAAQFRSTSLSPSVDFGGQGVGRQFAAHRHGMSTALCAWRLWQCAEGSKSHKYKALMPLRTSHASGYATLPGDVMIDGVGSKYYIDPSEEGVVAKILDKVRNDVMKLINVFV